MSSVELFWLTVGFTGQAVFTGRVIVQWLASEKRGESYVPKTFWYMSLLGSWLLLSYAIYRRDPVIIAGQAFGSVAYFRNLILIARKEKERVAVADVKNTVVEFPAYTATNVKVDSELKSYRRAG